MIFFPAPIIAEFILGLFLWWVAIYLITQNPFSRLIQVTFGVIAAVSFYFTSDVFFYAAYATKQFYAIGLAMKISLWSVHLPFVLLYQISFLLTNIQDRKLWQKVFLYFNYIFLGIIVFLETFTNYTRNYSLIFSPEFSGNISSATTNYFWLVGILLMIVTITTTINFYLILKKQPKFSKNWYKFFLPLLSLLFSVILGPITLLSYYQVLPYYTVLPALTFTLIIIPIMYSIIRYNLLIEEAKIIFDKTFSYSTLGIFFVLIIFGSLLAFSKIQFTNVGSLIFPYVLMHLIIATHPAYKWLTTFIQDIVYNLSSGLSIVNDEEVYSALRNYYHPERLESSSLLRLNLINKEVARGITETPVDGLRKLIKESVEYLKPNENTDRRTKQNLKYHLLRMLAFDQAEEGQILWELGFEEYPLRILSRETDERPPLFKSQSPSDYTYTSRNAFMALKKEAVHDVAWRISYLEKLSKKNLVRTS